VFLNLCVFGQENGKHEFYLKNYGNNNNNNNNNNTKVQSVTEHTCNFVSALCVCGNIWFPGTHIFLDSGILWDPGQVIAMDNGQ